jgi:DNA polymerase III sliding clamp (beta) subunit (PCNA family)
MFLKMAKKAIGKSYTNPEGVVALKPVDNGTAFYTNGDTLTINCIAPDNGIKVEERVEIPVDRLLQIRSVHDGPIVIRKEGSNTVIEAGTRCRYKINCTNIPAKPKEEFEAMVSIPLPRQKFIERLKNAFMFTANDSEKPVLQGVNLRIGDGRVVLAGTNGHYLYVTRFASEATPEERIDIVLPKEAAMTLIEAGKSAKEEEMMFSLGEKSAFQAEFFDPEVRIKGVALQGTFPNYDEILKQYCKEKEDSCKITIKRADLAKAVKRLSIVGDIIVCNFKEGVFTTKQAEVGSGEEVIDVDTTGKEPPTLGFSSSYLRTMLNAVDEEELKLTLFGELMPLRADEENTTILLMPVRID